MTVALDHPDGLVPELVRLGVPANLVQVAHDNELLDWESRNERAAAWGVWVADSTLVTGQEGDGFVSVTTIGSALGRDDVVHVDVDLADAFPLILRFYARDALVAAFQTGKLTLSQARRLQRSASSGILQPEDIVWARAHEEMPADARFPSGRPRYDAERVRREASGHRKRRRDESEKQVRAVRDDRNAMALETAHHLAGRRTRAQAQAQQDEQTRAWARPASWQAQPPELRYHVVAETVHPKTGQPMGERVVLTSSPVTHTEGATIIGKHTYRPGRRLSLVPVT